jgi:hypothetical protein
LKKKGHRGCGEFSRGAKRFRSGVGHPKQISVPIFDRPTQLSGMHSGSHTALAEFGSTCLCLLDKVDNPVIRSEV